MALHYACSCVLSIEFLQMSPLYQCACAWALQDADSKFANYKPKTAFFFPGQGAQSVGMCKVGRMEIC